MVKYLLEFFRFILDFIDLLPTLLWSRVNISDTGLIVALRKGHLAIAKFLIEKGANPDSHEGGHTVLMMATQRRYLEIAKLLIKKGANLDAESNLGYTATMWAVHSNNCDMLKILVENGANLDIQNTWGSTVLMLSARVGQLEMVKMLLKYGANHTLSVHGRTALKLALHSSKIDVRELLESYQEEVNQFIKNLDEATENNVSVDDNIPDTPPYGKGLSLFALEKFCQEDNNIFEFDSRPDKAMLRKKTVQQALEKIKIYLANKTILLDFFGGKEGVISLIVGYLSVRDIENILSDHKVPLEFSQGVQYTFNQRKRLTGLKVN